MDLDVIAHAHGHPRPGIDPVQAGLRPAPQAEAGGEFLVDRPGEGHCPVDKAVAMVETDHTSLEIGIEPEPPRHRPLIDSAFHEQGEGIAPATVAAEPLAALSRHPQGDAAERLDARADRDLAAALADRGSGAKRRRELTVEIIGEARAGLAAAERAAACQRRRRGAKHLRASKHCPAGQLEAVESGCSKRLRDALTGDGDR